MHLIAKVCFDFIDSITIINLIFFREKMAFFTKVRMKVPMVVTKPEGDATYVPRNASSSSLVEDNAPNLSENGEFVGQETVPAAALPPFSIDGEPQVVVASPTSTVTPVVTPVLAPGSTPIMAPGLVTEQTIPENNAKPKAAGPIAGISDTLLTLDELEELGDGVVPVTEL